MPPNAVAVSSFSARRAPGAGSAPAPPAPPNHPGVLARLSFNASKARDALIDSCSRTPPNLAAVKGLGLKSSSVSRLAQRDDVARPSFAPVSRRHRDRCLHCPSPGPAMPPQRETRNPSAMLEDFGRRETPRSSNLSNSDQALPGSTAIRLPHLQPAPATSQECRYPVPAT